MRSGAELLCSTYSVMMHQMEIENNLSGMIIGAAIEAHKILGGPGLLESVYEEALAHELHLQGVKVERQVSLPIQYKGKELGSPLRIDLMVGGKVIVEVKSTTEITSIYKSQLLTYLRLSNKKLGLLINFGSPTIKAGVSRVINSGTTV